MAASADKVQFIIETLLEQSLPLLSKAVFQQDELRSMMAMREKQQYAMLKTTFRLTDYLKAIQYEYSLERQRLFRTQNSQNQADKALMRKQSTADFVIVKRILKLWDRTMHKFKYRVHLWKQYMAFCIQINSKKHFYKALTSALRFLPFELDLWKIGAYYEIEVAQNMWKARKIFLKALKIISPGQKHIILCQEMLRFEVEFMRKILGRKKIFGGSNWNDEPMKFIGEEEEVQEFLHQENDPIKVENINIEEYDSVLWLVVQEAIQKNCKSHSSQQDLATRFTEIVEDMLSTENQKQIISCLGKLKQKISTGSKKQQNLQNQQMQEQQAPNLGVVIQSTNMIKIQRVKLKNGLNDWEMLDQYRAKIAEESQSTCHINWKFATEALKHFCLKPTLLSEVYIYLFQLNFAEAMIFLTKEQFGKKLPLQAFSELLKRINEKMEWCEADEKIKIERMVKDQIDKRLVAADYKQNIQLLKRVVQFNIEQERQKENSRLFRSISVQCKQDPEFVERSGRIINCL